MRDQDEVARPTSSGGDPGDELADVLGPTAANPLRTEGNRTLARIDEDEQDVVERPRLSPYVRAVEDLA